MRPDLGGSPEGPPTPSAEGGAAPRGSPGLGFGVEMRIFRGFSALPLCSPSLCSRPILGEKRRGWDSEFGESRRGRDWSSGFGGKTGGRWDQGSDFGGNRDRAGIGALSLGEKLESIGVGDPNLGERWDWGSEFGGISGSKSSSGAGDSAGGGTGTIPAGSCQHRSRQDFGERGGVGRSRPIWGSSGGGNREGETPPHLGRGFVPRAGREAGGAAGPIYQQTIGAGLKTNTRLLCKCVFRSAGGGASRHFIKSRDYQRLAI